MIDVASLKARADLAVVVAHYVKLKRVGREFVGLCVGHADKNPSMWVVPEKGFVHCYSCGFNQDVIGFVMHMEGCDFQAACEKLGAATDWQPSISDVPRQPPPAPRITSKPPAGAPAPDMALRGLGQPTMTWCYRDADGDPLGYVARYDTDRGKQIRVWTWGARADAAPAWDCGHWTRPRPMYGLDRLAARTEAPVLVVEGEKAADAAGRMLGAYVVVTWPGGAQAYDRVDWTALKGRSVLLWPDADAPGVEAMTRLGGVLSDPAGLACTVSVLDVSGMPEGSDAADMEADGVSAASVIAWAKPRKRAIAVAAPAVIVDRSMPPDVDEPAPPLEAPSAEYENPVMIGEPAGLDALLPEEIGPPAEEYGKVVALPARKGRFAVLEGGAAAKLADDPLPAALSDDSLADYFAAQHGDSLKYIPERSSSDTPIWYEWAGDGWQPDKLRQWFSKAIDVTRRALYWPDSQALSPTARRALNSAGKAEALLKVAKSDRRIVMPADVWDSQKWMLGIPGGSIDLQTGDIFEARKSDYITKRTAVVPAKGPHPLFDGVLARATGGDLATLEYLWRWFGYMLTGDTREECFLFLHGPGGSGKSTLTSVVADVLGDYAIGCSMETLAETKQPKHPEELARLDGARLVLTSETEEGQRFNESRIKWLTGRNRITARFMRANSFEFIPQFKLLVEGNHRPGLKSVGEEMRRRIHLIEYGGSIAEPDRDKGLKDKLRKEYPAILHSMVEGCLSWQERGLDPPDLITRNVREYMDTEDTLGAWLEECCDRIPEHPVTVSAAYKSFREWTEKHGEYCPSQKRFSQKLDDRGEFKRKRTAAGRMFVGFALKPTGVGPPPDDWP